MNNYDVFNGDADGLCALVQLRQVEPRDAELVSGVKRDIALLHRIPGGAHRITALDISLDKNRPAVDALLDAGSEIFYVDHHFPGEQLPRHPAFTALIDTDPKTCTSLLVDRHLEGRFRPWAITAAFGDNLGAIAAELAKKEGLTATQTGQLNQLGTCLNYNGYGASLDDLFYAPEQLFRELVRFDSPFAFLEGSPGVFNTLQEGYQSDMAKGSEITPEYQDDAISVVLLPDAPWSRRVSGSLGNALCNDHPDRAHAIVTQAPGGDYVVSIRAPLNRREGADLLARSFPGGGGRKAAAGINHLPAEQLPLFIDRMSRQFRP